MRWPACRARALLVVITVLCLAALSGCSGGGDQPTSARFVSSFPIGGVDPRPLDVLVDSNRSLYVLAAGPWQVKKYSISGMFVEDVISFFAPTAAAFGPNEDIYLVSPAMGRVAVFDLAGRQKGELEVVLPSGTLAYGVAVGAAGEVYLWTVDELAAPLAWSITRCLGGTCSVFVPGGLTAPIPTGEQQRGMAVDAFGNVYYPDPDNGRIVRLNPLTKQGTGIGSPGSGPGELDNPRDVALDSRGDMYVADTGNNRIQKFDRTGAFLFSLGAQGSGDGMFQSPQGVAVDQLGYVIVADTGNNRVQVFTQF
jgi:streptogramin lyase